MKTVCMILARGGSKRIPRKNVLELAGKPLVGYTIEAAMEAGVFARIVLSTDDAEISAIAKTYGIDIDQRPPELSGDLTTAVEVVDEYLRRGQVKNEYDNIAMMHPTCPFRTHLDVQDSMELFLASGREHSLVSVTKYDFPPQLALRKTESDHLIEMVNPESYDASTRSQSSQSLYHPNGAIYLSSTDLFLSHATFFHQRMMYYEMPWERSYDIDYPFQFKVADAMARDRQC